MTTLSTGGLGDSWIAFLKILDMALRDFSWTHLTGHEVHVGPIQELMELMPFTRSVKCQFSPKDSRANDLLKFPGATRVDSKAHSIKTPIIKSPQRNVTFPEFKNLDYVVIQPAAGRPDGSYRYFDEEIAQILTDRFAEKGIETILLGTMGEYNIDGAKNYIGKTNISGCISIISGAKHVVALDGFIAYVAMSFGIKTSVIFHEPQLYYHYMHDKWKSYTNAIVGSQKIFDKSYVDLIMQ